MKFKELKPMSRTELEGKLDELKMELLKSNAQIATGTIPKNPGQVKQTKKTIAKIKQILESPEEKQEDVKKTAPKKSEAKKEEKADDKKEAPKEVAEEKSQSKKEIKTKPEEKTE